MSNWTGQSKGTPLGYRIFIVMIKIDIRIAYLLLIPVSIYFLVFSSKKSIFYFYHKRLNYSRFRSVVSIYNNYNFLGKTLIDKIAILSGQKNQYSFNFDGEEHLHQLVKEKQGGLLLGAHMGNWEVAGELLERVDSVINVLMLEAEHQRLKVLLSQTIGDKKVNVIPIKDDMSHLFSVIEAFKRKELVAMHGDRYVEGTQFVELDFIGAKAAFPIGPMMLASKYKIPVTMVFSLKETNRHYHFFATEPKLYPTLRNSKNKTETIEKMMGDYVTTLEQKVKQYPLQWFNYHQFWTDETLKEELKTTA